MRGLDTNVLVRYLTRDDPAQFRRAEAAVAELVAAGEPARLDEIVLCELTWVLQSGYGLARAAVADSLDALLETAQFVIEDRDTVRAAVEHFRAGPGDFSDYLLGLRNRNAGCADTATFDRKLRAAEGFRLL